jgi:copper transport protein
MELTVDPARAGRNQIHLYLFDRRTGRQYDRVKELTVSARLPDRSIGPLPFEAEKAGPGHYVIRRAGIAPPGDWRLDVSARVSAFDAYDAHLEVPIR